MSNILTQAIERNDLDEALNLVMDALGIESGDVAGVHFSRSDANKAWGDADLDERHLMLAKWLTLECDDAGANAKRVPVTVAIYLVDKVYGGPEEGGWWYTHGSRVTEPIDHEIGHSIALVNGFSTRSVAEAFCNALQERLDAGANANRRSDIGSVLSEGRYEAHLYDGDAPNHFPETKPHYE